MPFRSEAQRRFLHVHHPQIAARWERHTPKRTKKQLPFHVGKSQLQWAQGAGRLGYKAASALSPYERTLLREQLANPGWQRRTAGEGNKLVRQLVDNGYAATAERANQEAESGKLLGVAYPTGPGRAQTRLASRRVFNRESVVLNRRAERAGSPLRTSGRQLRISTATHEGHHAAEMRAMPRREQLRRQYDLIHGGDRHTALAAATEGRAVGRETQVHGPAVHSLDRIYAKPKKGEGYNKEYVTRRETTAYHAGRAHPGTLLRNYRRDPAGKFSKDSSEPEEIEMSQYTDAFGVARPDLVAKFDPAAEGRRQRRVTAASSAIPGIGPVGGATAAGHFAPSGHKGGAFGRALGRGVLTGTAGGVAGGVAGAGLSAASHGRINPIQASGVGNALGSLAGGAHGTSQSLQTTQRRYGVRKPVKLQASG
jgi:hypothetical protein